MEARRSASGSKREIRRGRSAREESFDSIHYSEASNDMSENAYDADAVMADPNELPERDGNLFMEPVEPMTLGEVHRALHPLHDTAERVGKQVELFAEALDQLGGAAEEARADGATDCERLLPLVHEYERIAADTVKRLRRHHEAERQAKLKKRRKAQRDAGKNEGALVPVAEDEEEDLTMADGGPATNVRDLERWERERQTWQLLRVMLEVEHPRADGEPALSGTEDKFVRPRDVPLVHRYSSEADAWRSFLEQHPDMWEKNVVVEWLRACADETALDVDGVVESVADADAGQGAGWLYTKEAIKSQKRLRSWPQPLEPDSPGIDVALAGKGKKGESLVTQLDPDAYSRQGRSLEESDEKFELAMWAACWEMVRRGKSWESIREWFSDGAEAWRALITRGDLRLVYEGSNREQAALGGWQSRTVFRTMCANAAKNGGLNKYERAVCGTLGGDLQSVLDVSASWQDYLFAYYNSQLLQGFDFYVQKTFPDRLPKAIIDRRGRTDMSSTIVTPASTPAGELWRQLVTEGRFKGEDSAFFAMLQAAIVGKEAGNFLCSQGLLLGEKMHADARAKKFARTPPNAANSDPLANDAAAAHAEVRLHDFDELRILAHASFLLRNAGALPATAASSLATENFVCLYVDFLARAGKQSLTPLYASKLSPAGQVECMARQLPFVLDAAERLTVLRLMQQYGMPVARILVRALALVTEDRPVAAAAMAAVRERGTVPPVRVLRQHGKAAGKDTLPQIEDGFIAARPLSEEDEDLINGMEWFLLVEGHWKETMFAGSLVYKYFLQTGAISAAVELARRVPFSKISLNKTKDFLGDAVDLNIFSDEEADEAPSKGSKKQKKKAEKPSQAQIRLSKEYLLGHARTFRDLEKLVLALESLEHWKAVADECAAQADPRHAKKLKAQLHAAHKSTVAAVEPLLKDGWLQSPPTTTTAASDAAKQGSEERDEAEQLAAIRTAYLPEVLLAYLSVLAVGGQFISREILPQTMELAAEIADPEGALGGVFIAAGRAAELVDALGVCARTMIRAEEVGGGRGKRIKKAEGGLGVWRAGIVDGS